MMATTAWAQNQASVSPTGSTASPQASPNTVLPPCPAQPASTTDMTKPAKDSTACTPAPQTNKEAEDAIRALIYGKPTQPAQVAAPVTPAPAHAATPDVNASEAHVLHAPSKPPVAAAAAPSAQQRPSMATARLTKQQADDAVKHAPAAAVQSAVLPVPTPLATSPTSPAITSAFMNSAAADAIKNSIDAKATPPSLATTPAPPVVAQAAPAIAPTFTNNAAEDAIKNSLQTKTAQPGLAISPPVFPTPAKKEMADTVAPPATQAAVAVTPITAPQIGTPSQQPPSLATATITKQQADDAMNHALTSTTAQSLLPTASAAPIPANPSPAPVATETSASTNKAAEDAIKASLQAKAAQPSPAPAATVAISTLPDKISTASESRTAEKPETAAATSPSTEGKLSDSIMAGAATAATASAATLAATASTADTISASAKQAAGLAQQPAATQIAEATPSVSSTTSATPTPNTTDAAPAKSTASASTTAATKNLAKDSKVKAHTSKTDKAPSSVVQTLDKAQASDEEKPKVTAQSLESKADQHLMPLTSSDRSAITPEMAQAWSEELAVLERENIALRDRIKTQTSDPLQDIKVDSVTQIREDVLRARVVELEKELDKFHMDNNPDDLPEKSASKMLSPPPLPASKLAH